MVILTNTLCTLMGKNVTLVPLSSQEVNEDQNKMKKKREKEKKKKKKDKL